MDNRIIYIEFLRVICAIVVVIDHVCIAGIHIFDKEANCFEKFFYNGVQHWSHFAVPVFLMITGYLLLDNRREISYKKALSKYVWRMVVVLLIVGTAFAWMEIFFSTKSWAPIGFMNALWNTIQGDTWKHLWYLYTLVGLYLVLPVIKPIFEKLNTRDLDIFLFIAFFFASIMPTITSMTGIKLGISFPMSSIFLFYFMIGRRIGSIQNCDGIQLQIGLFTLFALSTVPFICAYWEYYQGMDILEGLTNYSSPLIVSLGILLFYITKSFESKLFNIFKLRSVKYCVQHLSANSFGIYIFHMLWVNIIYKVFKFNPLDYGIWIILPLLLVILAASDFTTIIYKKIPLIGKYI